MAIVDKVGSNDIRDAALREALLPYTGDVITQLNQAITAGISTVTTISPSTLIPIIENGRIKVVTAEELANELKQ